MIRAIILAADPMVRLGNLTKAGARFLLPIRGVPAIEYTVEKLQTIDEIGSITILTNSRFINQLKAWQSGYYCSLPLELIDRAGFNQQDTSCPIKDLALFCQQGNINGDLLVIGADNLFSEGLGDFINFASLAKPANSVGVYNLNGKLLPKKFGVLKLDSDNRVIDFIEKPESLNGSRLVSTCLYFFPKEKISLFDDYLKENQSPKALGDYIQWLSRKDTVKGYQFSGSWFDLGDNDSYTEAVLTF